MSGVGPHNSFAWLLLRNGDRIWFAALVIAVVIAPMVAVIRARRLDASRRRVTSLPAAYREPERKVPPRARFVRPALRTMAAGSLAFAAIFAGLGEVSYRIAAHRILSSPRTALRAHGLLALAFASATPTRRNTVIHETLEALGAQPEPEIVATVAELHAVAGDCARGMSTLSEVGQFARALELETQCRQRDARAYAEEGIARYALGDVLARSPRSTGPMRSIEPSENRRSSNYTSERSQTIRDSRDWRAR